MTVKIKGTGKSADMPTTYEVDLDKEQAENLVRKGFAVIVEDKKEEPVEEPKKEIKPMTVADNVVTKNEAEQPAKGEKAEKVEKTEKPEKTKKVVKTKN